MNNLEIKLNELVATGGEMPGDSKLTEKDFNKMVIDLVADRTLDLDKRLEEQFLRG